MRWTLMLLGLLGCSRITAPEQPCGHREFIQHPDKTWELYDITCEGVRVLRAYGSPGATTFIGHLTLETTDD